MTLEMILVIMTVAIKDGIPALLKILTAWQKENPDFDDIEKLHDIVKKPEAYFE